MEENKEIQPVPLIYSEGGITLPLSEDDFKDFMVSLLGKPELIEGYVEGAFSIDFSNVKNINYQIDNRISQQNHSSLLQFTAKLSFDDNSSISFNSLPGFFDYKESRPIVCTGFDFTWVYLIKFGNRKVFEKQEIRVYASRPTDSSRKKKSSSLEKLLMLEALELPKVSYSIRCTANTWGYEIAELINNIVSDSAVQSRDFANLRKNVLYGFSLLFPITLFSGFIIIYWLQAGEFREIARSTAILVDEGAEPVDVVNNIVDLIRADLLLNSISSAAENFFLSIVFSVVLCLSLLEFIRFPNYLFLLFNSSSIREKKLYLSRARNRKAAAILGIVFSVGLGVLSNYVFEYLKSR